MRLRVCVLLSCALVLARALPAQVRHIGNLNTRQIRALDRSRTVVVLQGGMLEEHGPYLPAFTDGILSARLTSELAAGIVRRRPGWTALVFPPISVGASGSNEIGRQFTFPGTYAVRPSTLRAAFVDLASELGEQGFRWVLLVHVHGSPLHIGALDDAADYFHDTYGGTMVNLWGLLPVLGGWGDAMSVMTPMEKRADGLSLHAGMDEHSLMLYLRPDIVAADFRRPPRSRAQTTRKPLPWRDRKDGRATSAPRNSRRLRSGSAYGARLPRRRCARRSRSSTVRTR